MLYKTQLFLYTSNEHMNTEIKNTISFTIPWKKNIGYKSNNMQDLCTGNYRTLMKERRYK